MPSLQSDAIVVFGVTGDLAHKMIFPALQALTRTGRLEIPVIGVAKGDTDLAGLVRRARDGIEKNGQLDAPAFAALSSRLKYIDGDYGDVQTFQRLKQELGGAQRPLFYLAIPPSLFEKVAAGLHDSGCSRGARIVVEKPFGHDLASAQALNVTLHRYFDEDAIFRIDHFLGKEPVENIVYFRIANPVVRAVWTAEFIESVEITMAEAFGVKGRGAFYDNAGALRDVVQNHLLELIACIAMEAPRAGDHESEREVRTKLLESMKPLTPDTIVRGQFKGYRDEPGVAPGSKVETYVAARFEVESDRWRGVPFFVRTGKCLPVTATEVRVHFKVDREPVLDDVTPAPKNFYRFQMSPGVGTVLGLNLKEQGESMTGRPAQLVVREPASGGMTPYERLLGDAMDGDPTLFAREDAVEAAWKVVEAVLGDLTPIHEYEPGGWGPKEADRISPRGGWSAPE